ncbi:MAG: SMC family ATPase, partial [Proteobacteria bacterium]|nr:SMC family ATPase [Pseudomonadota bacterium]
MRFEQASFWLDERAKAARLELTEQNRNLEQLQRQAAQTWSPYAPAADATATTEPIDAAEPEPPQPLSLPELQARIAAVVAAAAKRLDQSSTALEAAQQAKAAVDRQAERWDRRASAAATLADL